MAQAQPRTQTFSQSIGNAKPSLLFVGIILIALVAFEIFNFSTTSHALRDLLGNLSFGGLYWSTILALAFCGIDFAGIARLFTPEQGVNEPKEVWYLFGAWLLAATMNAILTWWGVSMAVANHPVQSSTVIAPDTIANIVPIFVATMVWVIRILIIGTLSLAMDRLLHPGVEQHPLIEEMMPRTLPQPNRLPQGVRQPMIPAATMSNAVARPNPTARGSSNARMSSAAPQELEYVPEPTSRMARSESTYHSLSARPAVNSQPNDNRFTRR
jgi:hypothetical protein